MKERDKPELNFAIRRPFLRNILRDLPRRLRWQLNIMEDALDADDVLLDLTHRPHQPIL